MKNGIINPFQGNPKGQEAFSRKVEEFAAKIKMVEATWTEQAVRRLCPYSVLWSIDRGFTAVAKWYFRTRQFNIMHKDDGVGGKWIIVSKLGQVQRVGHSFISGNQYLMQEATDDERAKVIAETLGQGTEPSTGEKTKA